MIDQEQLELRRDADRYRWLRNHAIRLQGSQNWYQGYALDIRVDVGRDHVAELAKLDQGGGCCCSGIDLNERRLESGGHRFPGRTDQLLGNQSCPNVTIPRFVS